jgi:hypothetical protein
VKATGRRWSESRIRGRSLTGGKQTERTVWWGGAGDRARSHYTSSLLYCNFQIGEEPNPNKNLNIYRLNLEPTILSSPIDSLF